MHKISLLLFSSLFFFSLDAKEFCIIASSAKHFSSDNIQKFSHRFPSGFLQQQDKYAVLKIDSFSTYTETKKKLFEVKKYYKQAFIINCTSRQEESIPSTQPITNFKQPELTEPKISKKHPIQIAPIQASHMENSPVLNEPTILHKHQISPSNHYLQKDSYDILNFKNYLSALFEHNDDAQGLFYQKKIDYLTNEIQKDRYNFDIFLNAYARTGQYISTQQTNTPNFQAGGFDESGVGLAINANKLLYDGQYHLINHNYDILNKRLADITALNAKEKLSILGMTIYSNLYTSQEKLRIFRAMYKKQKRMTQIINAGYNEGKNSTLNYIDSQNNLLTLQRALLSQKYLHIHNENILRHSTKSKSEKHYKLIRESINFHLDSLVDLQKIAIQNSSDIALESNKLKINQTDFLAQKRRYYPTINFQSHYGYGAANDALYFKNFNGIGFSRYWEAGLTLQLPIYNRKDIILNKEKELNTILKQKTVLSAKSREILLTLENSYNSLQRIQSQQVILQKQADLSLQKIDVAKESYFLGVAQYKDYSDAMRSYITYSLQLIDLKENYTKEMFLLGTLIGKRELYEQN